MPAQPPTHRPTTARTCVSALGLAALLAACGNEAPRPAGDEPQGPPAATPAAPAADPADVDERGSTAPLPASIELEVTVEGQSELREATLFESPQAYAIYVLPQMTMTPEEPCCDIAWARVDDGFSMRIERIDPDQDLAVLRENMTLALSAVGEAEPVPSEEIGAERFRNAELAMRARNDEASRYMLVARVDGGHYRVTLHLPHREALEGIAPTMWAMLDSLRTTGPRPWVQPRAALSSRAGKPPR